MKKLLLLFFVGLVLVLGMVKYAHFLVLEPLSFQAPIVFELEKGASAQNAAQKLYEKKLVAHPIIARLAMRFFGYDKALRAGEYFLEPQMSLKEILQKLTSGKVILHKLTLPEGLTTAQMLELIEKNEFLSGQISENVDEGEMLPETYSFAKGEAKNAIIRQAKKAMEKVLEQAWQARADGLPLKNAYELLILASIIEKETGINAERAKVASVFINRLNKTMLLQTDPTVIYALTLGKNELGRTLKHKDLEIDSPYNTYLYQGLPPTPICNPGLLAIKAAANPENTPYFYFVADGKGGHRFAKSLREHNQNIRLWLKEKQTNP